MSALLAGAPVFDSRRILSYRARRSVLLFRAALFDNAPRYS